MPIAPEEARDRVFEHWEHLKTVAEHRFQGDAGTAGSALEYALERMADRDWERVCCWQGKGSFKSFVTVIVSRLLTDYSRQQEGYLRPPRRIQRQREPLWQRGWELLVKNRLSRREALAKILTDYPDCPPEHAERVVAGVLATCPVRPSLRPVPLDQVAEIGTSRMRPEEGLTTSRKEMIEILDRLLDDEPETLPEPGLSRLLDRLRMELSLTSEERLILRMRYRTGLPVSAIARHLDISGDAYKVLRKLTDRLREACVKAGLEP